MTLSKTLIILRHGKAENGPPQQEDHTRKLTARGREAALIMGKYLRSRDLTPELVLCSAATRTTETFEHFRQAYAQPLRVEYSKNLYHASAKEIMNHIALVGDEVGTLLIVGHNPGMHQLALLLAKDGDEKLVDTLALKFPTGSMGIYTMDKPWADIFTAHTAIRDFTTPAMLGGTEE